MLSCRKTKHVEIKRINCWSEDKVHTLFASLCRHALWQNVYCMKWKSVLIVIAVLKYTVLCQVFVCGIPWTLSPSIFRHIVYCTNCRRWIFPVYFWAPCVLNKSQKINLSDFQVMVSDRAVIDRICKYRFHCRAKGEPWQEVSPLVRTTERVPRS